MVEVDATSGSTFCPLALFLVAMVIDLPCYLGHFPLGWWRVLYCF